MTFAIFIIIIDWILRILALLVVPPRRSPSSGTAWLLLMMLFPIPGWLLFALLGHYKLPRARRNIQARINTEIEARIAALRQTTDSKAFMHPHIPAKYQSVQQLAESYGHLPSLTGNALTLQPEYEAAFDDMVRDINRAKYSVYVEYYAATLDEATRPVFEALAAARQRGVDVRVLFDAWGSRSYAGYRPMQAFMQQADIPFHAMLPLHWPWSRHYVRPDLRNHRKIVVIDNATAYTGSQNLIDRTYHRKDIIVYDELVVRVVGPAVLEMTTLFLTDWISEGGVADNTTERTLSLPKLQKKQAILQLLPSGPGFVDENNLHVFTHLIHMADDSVMIVNPYLVPPAPLLEALTTAAQRGVRVQIINSQAIDQWMVGYAQRSFYQTLLEAGVEIYLYNGPRLLHAKFMIVDEEVAIVGSSNMDMRSFELTSELSLICYDQAISRRMTRLAHDYRRTSERVDLQQWSQRPTWRRMLENIARLTSAVQ